MIALGVVAVGNLMVLAEGSRFATEADATENEIIAAAEEAVAVANLHVSDAQTNGHSIEDRVDFRMKTDLRAASARPRSHLRIDFKATTRVVPGTDSVVAFGEFQLMRGEPFWAVAS